MQPDEQALTFPCAGEWLTAILSPAAHCTSPLQTRGVLVVVGGPQYRAGSHRQFALLARALAAQGISAMRFDYRCCHPCRDSRNAWPKCPAFRLSRHG